MKTLMTLFFATMLVGASCQTSPDWSKLSDAWSLQALLKVDQGEIVLDQNTVGQIFICATNMPHEFPDSNPEMPYEDFHNLIIPIFSTIQIAHGITIQGFDLTGKLQEQLLSEMETMNQAEAELAMQDFWSSEIDKEFFLAEIGNFLKEAGIQKNHIYVSLQVPKPGGETWFRTIEITDEIIESEATTGIESLILDESQDWQMFPNPTSGGCLHVQGIPENSNSVRIMMMSGQIVEEVLISNKPTTIDVSELAPGMYLVQVGNTVPKRLVVD